MTPQRIQRKRAAGWRMPRGAVYVGRPSRYGNPFLIVPAASTRGGPFDMWAIALNGRVLVRWDDRRNAAQDAVDRYRQWIAEQGTEDEIRAELAGKDLACWCRIDDPCHAATLLELANPTPEGA